MGLSFYVKLYKCLNCMLKKEKNFVDESERECGSKTF